MRIMSASKTKTWGIIPCSKEKIWDLFPELGGVRADRAYRSAFHLYAQQYVKKHCHSYLILSAKYGLMEPRFMIPKSYDVTFSREGDPYISMQKLRMQVDKYVNVMQWIVLCPSAYAKRISQAFVHVHTQIEYPLRGIKSFGAMHTWLKQQR